MARELFRLEKGIHLLGENAETGVMVLFGSDAPGGAGGFPDDAEIGSIYIRTTGKVYHKTADNDAAADWKVIDVTNVESALGIADDAADMGTFTGTILTDNTTVKALLQELEIDVDAIQTALGIAAEAVNFGSFTGNIIPDDSDAKESLQALETAIEDIQVRTEATNVTTEATIDSVLVDDVIGCEWFLAISRNGTPANRQILKVHAGHDGTPSADAVNVDDTVFGKLKLGTGTDAVVIVDLNGTGAAQSMRLRISSSVGVDVVAIRRRLTF